MRKKVDDGFAMPSFIYVFTISLRAGMYRNVDKNVLFTKKLDQNPPLKASYKNEIYRD